MKSKSNILSTNDSNKVYDIFKKGKSKEETIGFINYIEKTYDLKNFDYNFFSFEKVRGGNYNHHAAEAHFSLILSVFVQNKFNIDDPRLLDSVKYQINLMQKRYETLSDKSLAGCMLLLYLALVKEFSTKNELHELIKAYMKFLSILPFFNVYENDSAIPEAYSHVIAKFLSNLNIDIFANNPKFIKCIIEALNYADDDEPCLIIGETGTGKELIAKIIHTVSSRRHNNFWTINCTGFTESLFNSEISGIIKGGASDVETRLGAFLNTCRNENKNDGYMVKRYTSKNRDEICFSQNGTILQREPTEEELKDVGGTIFLDEINSLDEGLQAKLLRIIQENEVQVVGEDKKRKFNVKIICASNKDLSNGESRKDFRYDLYYRVGKGIIKLPALKEMRESVVDMARYHLIKTYKKFGINGKPKITKRAADKLKNYDWPGNFRELENVLYRAVKKILYEDTTTLKHNHIENLVSINPVTNEIEKLFSRKYYELEKMYIGFHFEKSQGNKAKMMRDLGYNSKSPINRLLREHGFSK